MTALAWLATPVSAGSGFAELVVRGSAGVLIPGLVSLRLLLGSRNQAFAALTRARQRSFPGRGQRVLGPAAPVLLFPGRWETSWLARAAWCAGPRRRWRGHLTAGKGTTDLQAATQAAGSPGPQVREKP